MIELSLSLRKNCVKAPSDLDAESGFC